MVAVPNIEKAVQPIEIIMKRIKGLAVNMNTD